MTMPSSIPTAQPHQRCCAAPLVRVMDSRHNPATRSRPSAGWWVVIALLMLLCPLPADAQDADSPPSPVEQTPGDEPDEAPGDDGSGDDGGEALDDDLDERQGAEDDADAQDAPDSDVRVNLDEALAPKVGAPTTASQALERAKEAYVEDEYDRVLSLMTPWATEERRGLLAPELQKDIYRLLALAHLLQTPAQIEEGRMWLGLLLDIDPTFRFVEGMVPPSVLEAQAEVLIERQNSSEDGGGVSDTIYIQKEVRINRRWLTVLPFGVGQFQNGDNGKGGVLATIQFIALSTNMISYFAAERLRSDTGFYTPNNKEIAEGWRVGQFVSLGVLVGFYLYGVIDALIYFEDESIKYRRLLQPPPELTRGPTLPMLDDDHRRLWLGFGEVAPAASVSRPLMEMTADPRRGAGGLGQEAAWGERSAVIGAATAPPPVMLLQIGADF